MSLYDQLYDWQKKIVDFAATKKAYGLFLDMGLGKTIQGLSLAEVLGVDKILVITKKSKACETAETPGSWQYWSLRLKDSFRLLPRADGISAIDPDEKQILVTNYEAVIARNTKEASFTKYIEQFVKSCKKKKVLLLLDESHCIKDSSTSQAKVLAILKRTLALWSADLHVYLLTGTPFTRGFIDVWNQLKFMGCPMTKTTFKENFCELGKVRGLLGWQQPIVGYKNIDKLYDLIHEYAITIRSADVVQLPEQIFIELVQPKPLLFDAFMKERITMEDMKTYSRLLNCPMPLHPYQVTEKKWLNPYYRNFTYPGDEWLADTPALAWLRARQLSIGFQGNADYYRWYDKTRLAAIKRLLEDSPDNYVLFYNYVPEFFELWDILEKLDYHIDVYNGAIKSLFHYETFAKQSPEKRLTNRNNIILTNFASGSTGMNWQLYNKCIIASLPVYRDWAQGLKRIHRTGSTEPVTYYVFSGDNWLDRDMRQALNEGTDYSAELFAANREKHQDD